MNRDYLLIMAHGGLGDHIVCNALYRHKARQHELICLPVKYHNVPAVAYMLRDLENVVIRPVEDDADALFFRDNVWKFGVLNLGGFDDKSFDVDRWDESFYEQAGVSFDATRWADWVCERDVEAETRVAQAMIPEGLAYPAIFVHEDRARGLSIKIDKILDLKKGKWIIEPRKDISPILFHWRTVIEACDEVHCISSSFAAFIDSIPLPKNPRLVLHAYARGNEPLCRYEKNWEILR